MSVPFSGVNLVWNLGGRGSGSTEFRFFQANFREILIFSRQFHKKMVFQANFWKISIFQANFFTNFGFSKEIFEKFRFFSGKFSKEFKFFRQLKKSIFQAKTAHFQLLLGKLFYFSSKVNTFEHTLLHSFIPDIYIAPLKETYSEALSVQLQYFLYMIRYSVSRPVHDPPAIPSYRKSGASQPPNSPQDWRSCAPSQLLIPIVCWMRKAIIVTFGSDGKSNPPSLLSNLLMCVMTAGVCAKNFITLGFWTFLQSGQSFFFRFTAWLV